MRTNYAKRTLLFIAMLLALAIQADAQLGGLGKKLKEKAKETINDATKDAKEDAVSSAVQATGTQDIAAKAGVGSGALIYKPRKLDNVLEPTEFSSVKVKKLDSWSESTSYDDLLAHYGYLLREQVKLINAGDFEALAKEFYGILLVPGSESEIFKIDRYIDRKAAVDSDYLMNRMDFNYPARRLTDTYIKVLFPSLENLSNIERVRDKSFTFTKKEYYAELDYLIQLAKRAEEGSQLKKLYSEFASIQYKLAGWEKLFKDENVEESDPEFVKAKQELAALGQEPGTLAELLDRRKQLEEKQRVADREYWTSRIPKDVIKDDALNAVVMNLAKQEWGSKGTPVKAILQHKEWQHKSNAFGKVTSRQKFVTIIMRMNDNTYRMLECSVIQNNDGVQYADPRLHEMFTNGGHEINWKE